MTDEHPLMRKARANLGLSTPVDGFDAMIDKINEAHYTDAKPRPGHQEVELVITTKADIANSKHLASAEAMDKLVTMGGKTEERLETTAAMVDAGYSELTSCDHEYLQPGDAIDVFLAMLEAAPVSYLEGCLRLKQDGKSLRDMPVAFGCRTSIL